MSAEGAQAESSAAAAAASTSSAQSSRKRVQVIGAPPPGPPIPRDDALSGDENEGDDDDDDARSVDTDAPPPADKETQQPLPPPRDEDTDLLATFSDQDDYLDLSHLSLKTSELRRLNLPRFKNNLKRLVLRQNLINKIGEADIGALTSLEELDLYDNSLEKTYGDVLQSCSQLESLDYSFNNIKHISHVAHLARLHTLYFVQNKISRVREGDFDGPIQHSLTSLELGGNRLRAIENIGRLTKLTELWLGKNKITKLENLEAFTSLRILSIQSNRITKIENLSALTDLEELYISHNGLTSLGDGLKDLKKLRVLDIAGNRVTSLGSSLEGLTELEEFWANDNALEDLRDLEEQLKPQKCPKLETVYLEGNPVQKKEGAGYRRKVMLALPQVSQIDATFVKAPVLR
ncbi:unnamed protein product [Parajaminaea phylloscopi]